MLTTGEIKRKLKEALQEEEDALVVAWFDFGKLLIFAALLIVCVGRIMDAAYEYVHDAPVGFYLAEDVTHIEKLHTMFGYIPIVLFLAGIFYVWNYSGMKKGQ